MPKKKLELIFPTNLIKEPIIHQMAKAVNVVFNIRRAKVTPKVGEIELELSADDDATLAKAEKFLTDKGVDVEPLAHTTVES